MDPTSEAELMERAARLAGRTLGELAAFANMPVPQDLKRNKGWVGQLIEAALGSRAGSKKGPDFHALGVELKTIPVDKKGHPTEATFVTVLTPRELSAGRWEGSAVLHKLRRILWLPVESDPRIPLGRRRVGTAYLWTPSPAEEARIQADWERFASWVAEGQLDAITAHMGEVLQVRPKAQNRRALRMTPDAFGAESAMLPRGFYLRASFTREILARHFRLPSPP
ncbi:MAG: DNA mismatch repair endonuclease MutH [Myxococcota bacterium]